MSGTFAAGRLRRKLLSAPMSVKIMGIAVGLTFLFAVSMFWQIRETWTRLGVHDEEEDAHHFACHEAAEYAAVVKRGDGALLEEMLRRAVVADPHIELAQVLDGQGRVLAAVGEVGQSGAPLFDVFWSHDQLEGVLCLYGRYLSHCYNYLF